MKIVALFGSPRANGNTATLAKTFNKTAEKLGALFKTFLLNKIDAKGCQACDACKTDADHCVIEDDLADVLESVKEDYGHTTRNFYRSDEFAAMA